MPFNLCTGAYGGWDSHGTNSSNGHGTIEQEMHKLAPGFDHAVSVFLEDLYDRGLEDNDLLATLFQFLAIPLDFCSSTTRPTRMLETGQPIAGL